MNRITNNFVAVSPVIDFDEDGNPHLHGSQCSACGSVNTIPRLACGSCGARNTLEKRRLGESGRLFTYTIVHRSFPGVETPFVAAVIDLEGGGSLTGTLIDIEPSTEVIEYDMPLKIVFRDTGQKNSDGLKFLSYFFAPVQESKA